MTELRVVDDWPPLEGVHRIGIKNDHLGANTAFLTFDGKPLMGVWAIKVELAMDQVTRVTITMDATLDIELAEALVA